MKTVQFQVTPEQAADNHFLRTYLANQANVNPEQLRFRWVKKSVDARKPQIKINCTLEILDANTPDKQWVGFDLKPVTNSSASVIIVGAGPAGLFAALRCLEQGIKPILIERGKDVRTRRRDLAILNKEGIVNSESNYCFGEGGAGTYSDGKLYTRSKKRGDVEKALAAFIQFGADPMIAVDAHPHIGTNKLPQIIIAMREAIRAHGGEVYFETKLTDIKCDNDEINSIQVNGKDWWECNNLILATGHSARDIFYLLHKRKVKIEAKPFALGVRVEHTQKLIDSIQYHGRLNDAFLPPAAYSLVEQVDGRGVYSFCMCPGGIVAPCATDQQEVVTNGWSPSKRNNVYSNSGIVVSVFPEDFDNHDDNPLVCLEFQQKVERACWEAAGETQHVPAQRLIDFVDDIKSTDFPRTSYHPGIASVQLSSVLPDFITIRLKKAFRLFDRKMKGFLTNDAVVHAPESRTSSPVAIPRNPTTLEHVHLKGLYPCGEGAGYAGGIISAAIDGMKCVDAIAIKVSND